MEYPCNQLCSRSTGAVTNNCCCIFFIYSMLCIFQNLSNCNMCVLVHVHARVVTERKELKVSSLFCYTAGANVLVQRCSCCIDCTVKDIFSLSINITH